MPKFIKITTFILLLSSFAYASNPLLNLKDFGNKLDPSSFFGNISGKLSDSLKGFGNFDMPKLDFLNGMNLNIADAGSLGNFLQTGITNAATSFGDGLTKGKCSVGIPEFGGSGISGVCDLLASGVSGVVSPIEKLLNNGITLGNCNFGANVSSKCAIDWLKQECNDIKQSAEDIANDFKKMANEKWEDFYEGSGLHNQIKNTRKAANKLYNNARERVSELGKKFKTLVGLDENLKGKMSGKCEETTPDKLLDSKLGSNDSVTLKEALNSEAYAYNIITSPNNGGSTYAAKVTFDCIKSMPKTNGIYDFLSLNKQTGEYTANEDKIKMAMAICSPATMTIGSASDIFQRKLELANDMSRPTNPSYAESVILADNLTAELNNQCVGKSDYFEAKQCEQKLKANTNSKGDENTTAYKMNTLETSNIREVEEHSSKFLALLDEIYPNELADTSDESLKHINPSQRSYFIYQAKKQELKDGLIMSFAKRIEESKKELARITMVKIKECSTPFYYAAASKEIAEAISSARQEADKVSESILNGF